MRLSRCFLTLADYLCTECPFSKEQSCHINAVSVSELSQQDKKDKDRWRDGQRDRQMTKRQSDR